MNKDILQDLYLNKRFSRRSATMSFVGPHRDLVTARVDPYVVYSTGTPWSDSSDPWADLGLRPVDEPNETVLHPEDFQAFIDLLEVAEPSEALVNAAARRGGR